MIFEWDALKAESNALKHGVSFQEAASVFADPLSFTYYDPDHSSGEHRFITVGSAQSGIVLIVAHTDRDANVRIISARRATRKERKYYEEND